MEFSLILVPAVRAGEPEPFETLMEQVELAEELGYDAVWFTEHHFSQYGRAAVPVLAAQAIERTSRLRISTAVVLMRVPSPGACRGWATLDHLSRGRVDVGLSRAGRVQGLRRAGRKAAFQRGARHPAARVDRGELLLRPSSRFPEIEVLPPYTKPIRRLAGGQRPRAEGHRPPPHRPLSLPLRRRSRRACGALRAVGPDRPAHWHNEFVTWAKAMHK